MQNYYTYYEIKRISRCSGWFIYITASSKFPEAEQLLQIRADDTTVIAISLYENQEAMERASATRSQSIDSAQDNIVSVDTKVGTVELNHS